MTLPLLCLLLTLGADTGRVEGTVVNGTTGKSVGPGVAVLLLRLDRQGMPQKDGAAEGTTDEEGRFGFAGQPAGTEELFVPRATWREVDYFPESQHDLPKLQPGQTLRFEITVYDTVEDAPEIRVSSHQLHLETGERGWLRIVEQMLLRNPGQTTWIGHRVPGAALASVRRTASLPLPGDAEPESVQVEEKSLNAMPRDGQVHLHAPLRPGTTTVTLTYVVPLRSFPRTVRRPVAWETASLTFSHSKRLRIRTAEEMEPVDHPHDSPEGEPLALLRTRRPLRAGSSFEFTMDEPEVPGEVAWLPILAGGVLLGAGFLFFQRRGREGADDRAALRGERERLLAAVARLDAEHAAGRLGRRPYRERREGAMRLLVTLTRDLDGRG